MRRLKPSTKACFEPIVESGEACIHGLADDSQVTCDESQKKVGKFMQWFKRLFHSPRQVKEIPSGPLISYRQLPDVEPIKPAQAARFIAKELCESYPRSGVLPGENWLEFDIVDIWELGPIGMEGRAYRHPSEALVRVSLSNGENMFILPERGNSQFDAIQRHVIGGKLISKDRHNGWLLGSRPKRDRFKISCENNLRLILFIEVFDPLKETPAIHIRADLIDEKGS